MKQTIFENKQRAEELMQEAIRIWRSSDHPDQLEGIEQDPVFSLLLTALAYQSNELENDLDHMKAEVLEEFSRMLVPYEVGHAIPATAVVQATLQSGLSSMELTQEHIFTLTDTEASFIPLLRTRVLNATIRSIVRMDGRRWKVSLKFDSPITDLSGLCFVVKNRSFKDLKVTVKGHILPIVSPWEFSELPLSPCFDIDTVLYNGTQTYNAAVSCLDLFARQNIRMYCVKSHQPNKILPAETESVDLVFEFSGIKDDFVFDRDNLILNSIILVNAEVHTADLTSNTPIVRVAGFQSLGSEVDSSSQQFLHMLRPSSDQIFGQFPVEVRKMSADRFNQGRLVVLLNTLISRYYTDFYAFQSLREEASDKVIYSLIETLTRMRDAARANAEERIPGVYLMLNPRAADIRNDVSLSLTYVTTLGSAINGQLSDNSTFQPPAGFNNASVRLIGTPVPGSDEVRDQLEEASLSRYYMITNDRLVTPADMKLFCYMELMTRYGITRQMVKSITVSHRQQQDRWEAGYEILVEIILNENTFIRRGFEEKIPQAETLMQAMISVRSANIYPVQVTITIDKQQS
jgi:hypothetical protein